MKGVTYFRNTGEIFGLVTANVKSDLLSQANDEIGLGVIEIEEETENIFMSYFVADGLLTKKAHFTLESIPVPATAFIEGVVYNINETPVTFSFDTPGTYEVTIDAGPMYYREVFTIDYQP